MNASTHICDFHLKGAYLDSPIEGQKKHLGNKLLEVAEKAEGYWSDKSEKFIPAAKDLESLPQGSWLFKIAFTLAKPFTSKAEGEFHHYESNHEIQNPIIRDHLTGMPMVRPTTWKGHLCFAARMIARTEKDNKIIDRLFGESLGEETGRRGRLHFFPTFFDGSKVKKEVITPLKRDTRTPASGPIDFEVIPAEAKGEFFLLYFPYPRGRNWNEDELIDDLELAVRAVKSMLLDYGFSAKKTASWGIVRNTLGDGSSLYIKGKNFPGPGALGLTNSPTFETPENTLIVEAHHIRKYSISSISGLVEVVDKISKRLRETKRKERKKKRHV
ncbi:MAG: hypothetical protein JRJ03_10285 [Deltaproteobacteria bacterium]|nr:hypothetical protein [Deltaproteobacteria bacterium]